MVMMERGIHTAFDMQEGREGGLDELKDGLLAWMQKRNSE